MRWKYEKVHTIRPTETRLDVPAIVEAHGHLGLHSPARAIRRASCEEISY
jgi:hypothetical protein